MCCECTCDISVEVVGGTITIKSNNGEEHIVDINQIVENYIGNNQEEPVYPTSIEKIETETEGIFQLKFTYSNEQEFTITLPNIKGDPGADATIEDIENALDALGLTIPSGIWLFYVGPMDNFDPTGLGKEATDVFGWAIANGNNGTTNKLNGRTIRLYNPNATEFDTVGKTGGIDTVVIAKDNLPVSPPWGLNDPGHNHEYNIPSGDTGNLNSSNSDAWSSNLNGTKDTTTSTSGVSLSQNIGGGQDLNIINKYYVGLPIQKL